MLSETFSTKLSAELAAQVRTLARENETGESAVLRLAVREFFKEPRGKRERIRKPHSPRGNALPMGG